MKTARVLITRARRQAGDFAAALQQAGFEPHFLPMIEIRPAADLTPLERALTGAGRYAWVVFTSVNAVEVVCEHLGPAGLAARFDGLQIAAIGPKTAQALEDYGLPPACTPAEYVAEAIAPVLGNLNGKGVLLPQAELARQTLSQAIADAGGWAHAITVYHTLPAQPDAAGLAALRAGVDWLTFTSPSTVQNFVALTRAAGLDPLALPGASQTACIGPITAQAALEHGFRVCAVADEYTTTGLIAALREHTLTV